MKMPSTFVDTGRIPQQNAWVEIRTDRLLANLQTLKKFGGTQTQVLAVVKANAYGHGLREIAKVLDSHVDYFGVSSIVEALDLKEHGIETPIFLFGRFLPLELPPVILAGVTLCVSSFQEAREISELSASLGRKTRLHIKVDTGMGRLGIPLCAALKEIEKIAALPSLDMEGIFTHFPTAEKEDNFAHNQLRDFILLLDSLEKKGVTFRLRHAANSSAALKLKSPALNMIRPGLMLYGIYPDPSLETLAEVSPILSLKSRIVFVKQLERGESVGYGRDYVAQERTSIAILPIGYSHGYPFSTSGKAEVLYQGKRLKVAGRISMDYMAVDLNGTQPQIGDEVTLLGESGSKSIRAEEIAQWAGTIPYEIVTRLPFRLPRFYR